MKKLTRKQISEIKKQALDNEISISSVLIKKDKNEYKKENKLVFNENFTKEKVDKAPSIEWNFEIGELLYYQKKHICLVLEKNENNNSYLKEKYIFLVLVNNKKITTSGQQLSLID